MMNARAKLPRATELRRLYEDELMDLGDVASKFGVSINTVRRELVANGIPRRRRCPNKIVCAGDVATVELRDIRGRLAGHAIVDIADAPLVSKHRWGLTVRGYVFSWTAKRMHVFLLGKVVGKNIDHINRNRLDNRRRNLRHVTQAQNQQNVGLRGTGKSGIRGVVYVKSRAKPWSARATLGRKVFYVGSYATPEQAAEAISAWRLTHMPYSEADRQRPSNGPMPGPNG